MTIQFWYFNKFYELRVNRIDYTRYTSKINHLVVELTQNKAVWTYHNVHHVVVK